MNVDNCRSLFPATRDWAYLNNAGDIPLPIPVRSAIDRVLDEHGRNGSINIPNWLGRVREHRQRVADLLGCDSGEIAFVRNTVEALSWVARGVRWKAGDNVVVPDIEFAGNVFPWWNLRSIGVEMRTAQSRNGRMLVDDILAVSDKRTRLVAVSAVQFSNGFRIDLERLGEACRERGILLSVDAVQMVGAMPVDVHALPIDFMSAGAHKWLMGPLGAGFFYCRQAAISELEIVQAGHYSGPPPTAEAPHELSLFPDARRFEGGIFAFPQLAGFQAAIDLLLEVGLDPIWAKIRRLTDLIVEGLCEHGYASASPLGSNERSGIISFRPTGHDPAEIKRALQEAGVAVSNKGDLIRVSPHFYNNEDDIQRFLAELAPAK